jgi:methylated-DNA-protein-cysteine methyltransferase-like protein
MTTFYSAVYALVRQIPSGRVMTYGQIATLLGCPRAARAVGYAMRASGREEDVPWHRVINSRGQISGRTEVERPMLQKILLEKEGLVFDKAERCELGVYQWEPDDPDVFVFETRLDWPF